MHSEILQAIYCIQKIQILFKTININQYKFSFYLWDLRKIPIYFVGTAGRLDMSSTQIYKQCDRIKVSLASWLTAWAECT